MDICIAFKLYCHIFISYLTLAVTKINIVMIFFKRRPLNVFDMTVILAFSKHLHHIIKTDNYFNFTSLQYSIVYIKHLDDMKEQVLKMVYSVRCVLCDF